MFEKIKTIAKKRGLVIGISVEGDMLNVSIIPKSMTDKVIPVSFSTLIENAEANFNKALDEMISSEMEMMRFEGFHQSLEEKGKPKKVDSKKKEDMPNIFDAETETKQVNDVADGPINDCAEMQCESEEVIDEEVIDNEEDDEAEVVEKAEEATTETQEEEDLFA